MLGWGLHKVFAKKLIQRIGPYSGLVYTNSFLVSVVVIYCLFTGTFAVPSLKIFILIIVLALLGALGVASFYKSMDIGKLSVVVPVANVYSALIVVFALVFFRERMAVLQFAAILLAIAGTLLISFKFSELKRLNLKNAQKGVHYAIFTALMWGIIFFMMKIIVDELGIFVASLYFESFVLLFILLPALFGIKKIKRMRKEDAYFFLGSGILVTIGALAYNAGIKLELVSIVGPLSAASLMVAVLASWLFLKEKIDINQKIAVAMIFAAVILLAL